MIYCMISFILFVVYFVITIIEIRFWIEYTNIFWCKEILIAIIFLVNFLLSLFMLYDELKPEINPVRIHIIYCNL
jgi:hypothetical protein